MMMMLMMIMIVVVVVMVMMTTMVVVVAAVVAQTDGRDQHCALFLWVVILLSFLTYRYGLTSRTWSTLPLYADSARPYQSTSFFVVRDVNIQADAHSFWCEWAARWFSRSRCSVGRTRRRFVGR